MSKLSRTSVVPVTNSSRQDITTTQPRLNIDVTMTATYEPLKLDEAIAHLSKSTLANALKVHPRTLERDLRILKSLIQDTTELDHKQGERGYPVNTAKYLILFRALVTKGMSPLRAGETLAEQSFRGVDYLIELHLNQTIQPIQDLINQLLSGESNEQL